MDLPTGEVLLLLDQVVTLFLPGPRAPGTPRPGAGAAEAARGAPLPVTPPPRRPGGDSSASSWGRLRACLGQGVSPPPGLPVPISQGDSEPLLGTWHGSYRPSGLRPGPGSDKTPPATPENDPTRADAARVQFRSGWRGTPASAILSAGAARRDLNFSGPFGRRDLNGRERGRGWRVTSLPGRRCYSGE